MRYKSEGNIINLPSDWNSQKYLVSQKLGVSSNSIGNNSGITNDAVNVILQVLNNLVIQFINYNTRNIGGAIIKCPVF